LELRVRQAGDARERSSSATQTLIASLQELSSARRRDSAPEIAQLNWLLTAARLLNELGGIDDILNTLLKSTLELTGFERGFVFIQEDGELRLRCGRDANGAEVRDDSTISQRAVGHAIATTESFSISDTLADQLTADWQSVKAHNIRSIYCIPLRKRSADSGSGELLGLLYLDSRIEAGAAALTRVNREMAEMIATEAAALLHNALMAEAENAARQAQQELAVAARIHSGLMSTELPELPFARIHARTLPCLAIGGDFYDVVELDGCVCIAIADVSGKGVSAAIVAATLQGIIHALLLSGQSLPEIADLVNRFLCGRDVGKYATMVLLKLFADGRLEYINCGHVHPLAIFGEGEHLNVRKLDRSNLVVGLIPFATYAAAEEILRPGERIFLATDGVTEAEDGEGRMFGDRVIDCVGRARDLEAILAEIVAFQASGGRASEFSDDCTMLQVEYRSLETA
jgi:serine phosphatase RsbU (regulator of sigma subunit)